MTTEEQQPETNASEEQPEEEAPLDPMAALEQERDQFKAMAQRAQADFVNFKRRMDEERAMIGRNASSQVLAKLLHVMDDLERAVEHIPADADASWADGVKMVAQNFHAIMNSEGVSAYEPQPGDTFDPTEHEAVFHQPSNEQPAGTVLTVVRAGYKGGDRVLRPAQVVVSQGAPESGA